MYWNEMQNRPIKTKWVSPISRSNPRSVHRNIKLGSPGMRHEGVSDDESSLLNRLKESRESASFSDDCVWKAVERVDLGDGFVFYWRVLNFFATVHNDSQEIKEVDRTYLITAKTLTLLHAHALVVFASLRNRIRWVEQCELNDAILIHSYRSIGEIIHYRHWRSRVTSRKV